MRGSITSSTTGPFELCVHTHVCFHKEQFHQIDPLQCVSCGVRAFLRFSVQQQNDNKKKKLFFILYLYLSPGLRVAHAFHPSTPRVISL